MTADTNLEKRAPIEGNEFYGGTLLALLARKGLNGEVYHSGGNCATFEFKNGDSDVAVSAGPGSFNASLSAWSVFTTDELIFSEDFYDNEGNYKDEEPVQITVEPGTPLTDVADAIYAKYIEVNA